MVGAELLLHRAASWRVAVTQGRAQSGVGSERDEPLDSGGVERSEFVDLGADFRIEAAVLVEVHDGEELERAAHMDGTVLGINNRDLRTFETHLHTTIGLRERVPAGRLVVTESGIHTPADVALMRDNDVHAFLVGEAFMRAPDPGTRLAEVFGG